MPELIALYEDHEDHKDHREKFEILAIHDESAKTFAELDAKLPKLKERYWQNKDLPFPVLLDSTNATGKAIGISHYPTTLLIDPEGKLVGEVGTDVLGAKLPPLPVSKTWARYRNLQMNVHWSFDPKEKTLEGFVEAIRYSSHCKVELDLPALAACGLKPDSPVPGILVGGSVTLRSAEELLLAPHGLGIVPDDAGKKLLITKHAAKAEPESHLQKLHSKDIADKLAGASFSLLSKPKRLTITEQPLDEAVKLIANEFGIAVSVDAKTMHDKTIDPKLKLSGTLSSSDFGKTLTKLLDAAQLKYEVRSETIWLTRKPKE